MLLLVEALLCSALLCVACIQHADYVTSHSSFGEIKSEKVARTKQVEDEMFGAVAFVAGARAWRLLFNLSFVRVVCCATLLLLHTTAICNDSDVREPSYSKLSETQPTTTAVQCLSGQLSVRLFAHSFADSLVCVCGLARGLQRRPSRLTNCVVVT